ncbi:hypothetical protein ACIP9C_04085 [Lysinibacillus sp. NPDC093210]|uniref:hypothetical protein n=1 Tax=Lysinibacillus sp. NPDC093210 TaxID=3364133 RepID=UPI003817FE5D
MAIISSRRGASSIITVTPATLLKMEHALLTGVSHLESKYPEHLMADAYYLTSPEVLNIVFGETSAKTVANRTALIYSDGMDGVKEDLINRAKNGARQISAIHRKAINSGDKNITLTLTYYVAFNLHTSRTVLKYIVDAIEKLK